MIKFPKLNVVKGNPLKIKNVWSKQWGLRGIEIENYLAKINYYEGFTPTNKLLNKAGKEITNFDYIDFVKDNIAISVKTTNAKGGFADIIKNIDNLSDFVKGKATNGKQIIDDVRLEIFVSKGFDKTKLKNVLQRAQKSEVNVKVTETED